MRTDWIIKVSDFALGNKVFDFDHRLNQLGERILTHELIHISDRETILGTIQGTKDQLMRPVIGIKLRGCISLICQLCLEPFEHFLNESARLVIFKDDESLQQAVNDEPNIEGIVSHDGTLDVHNLIEEQILLAIPFSPKHEACENKRLYKETKNYQSSPLSGL